MKLEIDKIDRKILNCLQTDGRMSNADIAEQVSVSSATCHRRIQRLVDDGIILGFRAEVNPRAVDRDVLVVIGVVLEKSTPESFSTFEAAVTKFPFVLDCQCVAGDFDYFMKIRVRDVADFNRLHRREILTLPGVRQLRSFFVVKEVIDNAPLTF